MMQTRLLMVQSPPARHNHGKSYHRERAGESPARVRPPPGAAADGEWLTVLIADQRFPERLRLRSWVFETVRRFSAVVMT